MTKSHPSSFRGAAVGREPGIQNDLALDWIPALASFGRNDGTEVVA
jgi:hypothetical protein